MNIENKFRILKQNIKDEYKLSYPNLKQISDQLLSEYINVSRSEIANFYRYKTLTQTHNYKKLKRVNIDKLAFRVLTHKKKNV